MYSSSVFFTRSIIVSQFLSKWSWRVSRDPYEVEEKSLAFCGGET